jgi:hypothetical protein
MTWRVRVFAFSAIFIFSASAASANVLTGPPCQPGETRSGWVYEASKVPNTNFIVHLTDSGGGPVGPAGGIPLQGMNVPGDGSVARLPVNQPGVPGNVNQPGACDAWNETILPNPGNGNGGNGPGVGVGGSGTGKPGSGVGGNGGTPTTPQSSLQIESYLYDRARNAWVMYNIFTTVDLSLPNGDVLLIPDLYATDSNGDLINQELYGLVNLAAYLENVTCTLNVCKENFNLGDTFTVVAGEVAGLPGMYFSTNPWTFTPAGGWVDPGDYSGTVIAITDHGVPSVPESSTWAMMLAGFAGLSFAAVRRGKGVAYLS